MLKRVSIFTIGTLFAFSSIFLTAPVHAAPYCTPTSTTNGTTTILSFTAVGTCTWVVPANVSSISILIVGGGGGGGGDAAGGGGGGGVYLNTALAVAPLSSKNLVVGAGGNGGQCSGGNASECTSPPLSAPGYIAASNGSASVFESISVAGGGKGGVYNSGAGSNGGSGGGGAATGGAGGTSTISSTYFYGNSGGASTSAIGGGGGGAGQAGSVGTQGKGGDGIQSDISGSVTYYAGGGGGGSQSSPQAAGGSGGGGAGAESCSYQFSLGTDVRQARAGTPNTGGGGGGAPYGCAGSGGAGGSGVVIIAYTLIPTINSIALSTGSTTATYRAVNTIQVTLTSDGRIRFFADGKQISGCASVMSISSVASCVWRPSNRGARYLTARVIGGSNSSQLNVNVLSRTNKR